jgi:serpin B
MKSALHFTLEPTRLHEAFARLLRVFRAPLEEPMDALGTARRPTPELLSADRLWCPTGLTLGPAFVQITKDQYGAPIEQLDFQKSPESARETINRWIERETHEKIKDLLGPGAITSDTRLVVTNATYFKAAWASPFPKEQTRDEAFFTEPSRSHPVPMMHQRIRAGYAEVGDAKVLELPYASGDPQRALSLVILLPNEKDGIADLEASLDAKALSSFLGGAPRVEVIVSLPRFKMTSAFDLSEPLEQMGMRRAFTDGADFSGITADEPLALSRVVHKAFVDVNEEGTEAAAATGVVAVLTSMVVGPRPVFRADHPFLMLLRDDRTGSVLFMGRVVDPAA